jgi:hypothetical protein
VVNGELVTERRQLKHGDKVLFGNNNLFVLVFPGNELDNSDLDYQGCMKMMMSNQLGYLTDPAAQAILDKQLDEMRRQLEQEKLEMMDKL